MIALAHLPALEAKAHLETSIHALFGEEQQFRTVGDTAAIRRSKRRVSIGGQLVILRRVMRQRLGERGTSYLNSGILPFEYHSAYDYIDEWWLYYHGGED